MNQSLAWSLAWCGHPGFAGDSPLADRPMDELHGRSDRVDSRLVVEFRKGREIGRRRHRLAEAMNTDLTQLDWSWVTSHAAVWALVLARVVGVCMTAPAIVVPGMEWRFRLALALMLGALIAPAVEPRIVPVALGAKLAWMAATEVIVGGLLGWSAALIVAAARQAGELVSAQAGLSAAALFDPATGDELTPLGHLYGLIALAVFLALDGPLMLVGAMIESYQAVPAGGFDHHVRNSHTGLRPGGRRPRLVASRRGPSSDRALPGRHRHGLDRTASSRRSHPVPLSARSRDSGNCARLSESYRLGCDVFTGMEPLVVAS